MPKGIAPRVVWAVWAVLTAVLLGFVAHYGIDVPYSDDITVIPQLTGTEAVTPQWLWSLEREHRIPLPKLVLVGIARASGVDFRATLLVSAIVLSVAAAALLVVLGSDGERRLMLADAFVPIALLHVGHAENVLWAFAIQFVLSTTLSITALVALVRERPSVVGVAACLLPLCGAQALPTAAALAVWLLVARRHRWAIAVMGVMIAYLIGYEKPANHPSLSPPGTTAVFALHVLGSGWTTARHLWPLATACAVATYGTAVATILRQRSTQMVGYGAMIAGGVGSAVLVGLGRAGFGIDQAHMSRYALLTAPAACAAYLSLRRVRFAGTMVGASMALMLIANVPLGIRLADDFSTTLRRAKSDLDSGMPLEEFCDRYVPHLHRDRRLLCDRLAILVERRGRSP